MNLYPLFSGSSGNCTLLESGDTKILIDAGLACKTICEALAVCGVDPATLSAILITHEHSDHIKGAGILSRKFGLPIYANEGTWDGMESKLGIIDESLCRTFDTDKSFCIDNIDITPFSIPHDTNDPVAFSFIAEGKKVSIATDIGHVTKRIEKQLSGSDLLLMEANHDVDMLIHGSYPKELQSRILSNHGHLSNEKCGETLCRLYKTGVKRSILGHLSRENNTEKLAVETVSSMLAESGIGRDYMLKVAHHDRVSGKFEV